MRQIVWIFREAADNLRLTVTQADRTQFSAEINADWVIFSQDWMKPKRKNRRKNY
jgi:hypothetical protein